MAILLCLAAATAIATLWITERHVKGLRSDLQNMNCANLEQSAATNSVTAADHAVRATRCNYTANQSLPFAEGVRKFAEFMGFFIGLALAAAFVVAYRLFTGAS
ncbi:MAG: hypothetical protein ACK5UX_05575 [Burkholderiales bacterium]